MDKQAINNFKNSETEGHLERVKDYTEELLRLHNKRMNLGFSETYMQSVIRASYMHDIGKAGVPERILYKEGPLTEHERTIIETHPLIGAYMFEKYFKHIANEQSMNDFIITKNIIKYHHEKWDGTGYPEGLTGKEIPFEARLITIVDNYDALTSERCYKEPWTEEEAMNYIQSKKGEIFDPELVNSFVLLKNQEK